MDNNLDVAHKPFALGPSPPNRSEQLLFRILLVRLLLALVNKIKTDNLVADIILH